MNEERNAEMQALYDQGLMLQQIGDKYGLTRERVRQCIDTSARQTMRALQKATAAEQRRLARLRNCELCGVEFEAARTTGPNQDRFCCREHSRTWYNTVAYQVDPQRRASTKRAQARHILRYPERYPHSVNWARRYLEGDTAPNRRFMLRRTANLLGHFEQTPTEEEIVPRARRGLRLKLRCKHGHPRTEMTVTARGACKYCNYVACMRRRGYRVKPFEEWLEHFKSRKEVQNATSQDHENTDPSRER